MVRYRMTVLTERDTIVLMRLVACLVRHRIDIRTLTCNSVVNGSLYLSELDVRGQADRVRRAAKHIGALVGVVRLDYLPTVAGTDIDERSGSGNPDPS